MYKAVAFDFGNVLCALDREAFCEAAASHSRLSARQLLELTWGGDLELHFETGKLDSRSYFRRLQELAGFEPSYRYEDFVADYRKIILPNPDGEAGLKRAKELGARTFVLSNTSFLHACMIFENETLASVPELHVLSYKVGVMKPNPGIWLKLLEYSGLQAHECCYVDDIKAYCDAASAMGFNARQYRIGVDSLSRIVENMLQ